MNPLIDAAALAAQLADERLVIVDCRHDLGNPEAGEAAWRAAHIPGALFMHLDRDLSAPKSGRNGRHPLPSPDAFASLLGRFGITPAHRVVAYDDAGGMFAARLWWMLRRAGHRDVSVLDGGLAAWRATGAALDDSVRALPPSTYPVTATAVLADADEVLANIDSQRLLLVDARAPDRFRGENETLDPVGGHIPGALNRFFKLNLGDDGRFKPADVLHAEWRALIGARDPQSLVMQCGSGVTACHNLLALELAGLSGARLYPGSWSEWCSDADRPVAR
ncbi:MAG: sulfurtransferase [Gammaproteobacteria bacterium]|jgi:thiosulfate/3-mercaptopyruvate sulfurtransferase|nr:sulfurtransferase [Gammaproteobacteria bacterium]MBU0772585.1 sulfurtransferase [Gammaproteobacteria bacterium]MBU0855185.1 sulfurtransferase [Gammaproteobacteria bacterium]MBU1847375.1 sulfurtransferase [Gammaproteobacteria bacterium]